MSFWNAFPIPTQVETVLPIEVIPVVNAYDHNRSQYQGGGLTGPVVVLFIQTM